VRIGLDLGGTKVYGVRLDGETIAAQAKRKTPTAGTVDDVVEVMAGVVDDLGGTAGVTGLGVGSPGAVDPASGVVREAGNVAPFAGHDVALAALLRERLGLGGVPVRVGNDVTVAVQGELTLGAGRGERDFVGIWVGTGVGGGVVLDGVLRQGPHGLAGEIGHTVVDLDGGARCGCGRQGHLEAYAGRGSMERQARERHAGGVHTALVELAGEGRMTSGVWSRALDRGDRVATHLMDHCVEALGCAVASAVTLLDVDLVIIGGGLAEKLGVPFTDRIAGAASRRLFPAFTALRVVPGALGDAAGAVGAALLASVG
jgi:glucokinase